MVTTKQACDLISLIAMIATDGFNKEMVETIIKGLKLSDNDVKDHLHYIINVLVEQLSERPDYTVISKEGEITEIIRDISADKHKATLIPIYKSD